VRGGLREDLEELWEIIYKFLTLTFSSGLPLQDFLSLGCHIPY
jgi:hypothetical protein